VRAPGECLFNDAGETRCIDPAAATCADVVTAAPGRTAGDLSAAYDGLAFSCSDGFGNQVEQAFDYQVRGTFVVLDAKVTGIFGGVDDFFTVAVTDGVCTDDGAELECQASNTPGRGAGQVAGLSHDDRVTIFVESDGASRFVLDVTETEIVELAAGDACVPGSNTGVCGAGLACLGGPSPRAFTCLASPHIGADGEACVEGSTDQLCDASASLFCNDGICGTATGSTSGSFTGTISNTDPTSSNRLGFGSCQPAFENLAEHFDRYRVTNPNGAAANLTVDSGTGCNINKNDTIVGAYRPSFDPTNIASQCVLSNDDVGGGNFCSKLTVSVPANSTTDIVVWMYGAPPQPYTLSYTSTVPVVFEPN
jgi:hypothetical protein